MLIRKGLCIPISDINYIFYDDTTFIRVIKRTKYALINNIIILKN